VADTSVVLADARDLDPAERDALAASQVRRVPADPAAITSALDGLGRTPVYLHLDVDVIDSAQLPGLRFPSGPGPALAQIEDCLAAVCAAADVAGAASPAPGCPIAPATRPRGRRSPGSPEHSAPTWPGQNLRRNPPGDVKIGCAARAALPPGPCRPPGWLNWPASGRLRGDRRSGGGLGDAIPAGAVSVSGMPSGTVTLLFTDVEGSTRLWDAERDAMAAALRRHDEILRDSIEQAGGYVFKTVGDSFCAAFSAARAGLEAALAAQQNLAAQSWPTSRPIVVRMGLHAGVCEERDGDYFGPAVNRTARLLAVADGGQVLVSGVAAELLSDELPEGVGLRELGTHQLKDLSRPERIYQVEAAFLAARLAVPAARQPGRPAGTLASHADRERVVDVLRTAAGDGRLTADDLDQRLEAALTARTLADLEPLLADLTVVAVAEAPDLARIECGSGTASRDRSWMVPRRLEIQVGSGTVRLDFREAVIAAPELRIDVQISSGTLKLITRPGIVVDTDDVKVNSGSVRVKVPPAVPDVPVELRVKVSGRVGSGTISARPARRGGRWRALWRWILRRPADDSPPALPAAPR
jgi:class 3 adenylate cyclase